MKQCRDHKYVRGRIEILDKILRWEWKFLFVGLKEKLNDSLDLAGYPKIRRKTLFNDQKFEKKIYQLQIKIINPKPWQIYDSKKVIFIKTGTSQRNRLNQK